MYATWLNYNVITNMGTDLVGIVYDPVIFSGQKTAASRLSSPSKKFQVNPYILNPNGVLGWSHGSYSYGARSSLYRLRIITKGSL